MEKTANQQLEHYSANQSFPNNASSSHPSTEVFGGNSTLLMQVKQKLYPSFFSAKGLAQDILEVTQAEPDIPLNAFIVLKPRIEKLIDNQSQSNKTYLRDKWLNFLGTLSVKGILHSPEYLIGDQDASQLLARLPGEKDEVFKLFQQVFQSIKDLEEQIVILDNFDEKEETLRLFRDIQAFYNDYKAKILAFCKGDNKIETKDLIELSRLIRPKAIMFGELLPKGPAYRISKEIAYHILSLDNHGIALPKRPKSNHRVSFLPYDKNSKTRENPQVFFKSDDGLSALKPGNEAMLYSFYRLLNIPIPQTGLLMITGINNNSSFYVVQASEAVVGESPETDLSFQDDNDNFEEFCQQTVGAILTNPNDGKPTNFIYHKEKFGLVSIDNDDVFCCDFSQTYDKKDYLIQAKSLFFCLQTMDKPISRSLADFLTILDPHLLLLAWLDQLKKKNQEYEYLESVLCFENARQKFQRNYEEFTHVNKFLDEPLTFSSVHEGSLNNHLSLPITPSSQLFGSLQTKLSQMIKVLSKNSQITLQELFENISPCLGVFYKKLRSKFPNPLEAIAAIYAANGSDCCCLSSLIDIPSLEHPISIEVENSEGELSVKPEDLFSSLYQSVEKLDACLLDKFVKKHGERRMKSLLQPEEVLKELFHLLSLKFTRFRDAQNIVDFWYKGKRDIKNNVNLIKEWDALFFALDHPELKWLFCLEKYFSRGWKNTQSDYPKELSDVKGAFIGKRCLSQAMMNQIFDKSGAFQREGDLTGRSQVARFPKENPIFYLKKSPEIPGYEYAATFFMRSLGLENIPFSELLLFQDPQKDLYSVLLTQAVPGNPLHRVWKNDNHFASLDPHHTFLLILCSILLNPEDGKGDNYILTPDRKRIIPIDNDHVFLPGIIQEERGFFSKTIFTELQSKTVLYGLHEMNKPIPSSVVRIFAQLDIDKFLDAWFKKLVIVDENYQNLPPQDLLVKEGDKGTFFRIVLPQEYIKNLYFKLCRMKELLSLKEELTPFAVLKSIEPYVEKLYREVFLKESSVENRFMRVTKTLYKKEDRNGNQVSNLNSIQMFKIFDVPRAELVNQAFLRKMSPLEILEVLRTYKEQVKNKKDPYQDLIEGKLESEKIDASNYSENEERSTLKRVLSQNRETLLYLHSPYLSLKTLNSIFQSLPLINACNKLKLLDLRSAQSLTGSGIAHVISKYCPNLEYLDLSGNRGLQALVFFRENFYSLKRLIINSCPNLTALALDPAFLDVLEINNNEKLGLLFLDTPNLTYFDWSATQITGLIHCFSRMDKLQIVKKSLNGRRDCFFNVVELCDGIADELREKKQVVEMKSSAIEQFLPFDGVLNEVEKILDQIEVERAEEQKSEEGSPRKKIPDELVGWVMKMVEMFNLMRWLNPFRVRLDYIEKGLGTQEISLKGFEMVLDVHEKFLQRPFGILTKIRLSLRKISEMKHQVEQMQKRTQRIWERTEEIDFKILVIFTRMKDLELMKTSLDENLDPNPNPAQEENLLS